MRIICIAAMLIFIGFSSEAYAQEVIFGVKTGLNFSKFGKDVDLDGRTSFFIGVLADITLENEQFHIQPEVQYSAEGSEDTEANFIRIIPVGKYYPVEGLSFEAGPQFGIRVSAEDAVKDATKSFDYGVALGVGYEFVDIGLLFSARYNVGIADLGKNNLDTNLATFQLGIGYKFY